MAVLMQTNQTPTRSLFLSLTLLILLPGICNISWSAQPRIKDITQIRGVQPIHLVGLGLVTGLNGTGGTQDITTATFLKNMYQRFGSTIPLQAIQSKNAAMVMVHASLPPYAKQGSKLDVTVTSPGNATSLRGGYLEPTLLADSMNPEGPVYVRAAGAISLGGFNIRDKKQRVKKNHATTGRVPGGGIVEKEPIVELTEDERLTLVLYHADFTTATNIADVINQRHDKPIALATDAGTIQVQVPEESKDNLAAFIATIGNLHVAVDQVAAVIIDERTGTIVIGENVQISPVAVTYGSLRVEISSSNRVSQPLPLTQGETMLEENSQITVTEEDNILRTVPDSTTIQQVVDALNALGATPQDLITILQNIAQQGALHAQLIIR